MTTSKIAITINDTLLRQLDGMVKIGVFPNRSRAIQEAVAEKLGRIEKTRLAQECAKLDPDDEQRMADEGFSMEMEEWPAY
jgi:metal-responsive CopG/Arc/MetJ family transcriptional regulator